MVLLVGAVSRNCWLAGGANVIEPLFLVESLFAVVAFVEGFPLFTNDEYVTG